MVYIRSNFGSCLAQCNNFLVLAVCMESFSSRGGVQQRLKRARISEYSSELATFLAEQFAWGEMSPQQIAKISRLACRDLERSKEGTLNESNLLQLAALGSHGAHPQDMHQQMLRILPASNLPIVFSMEVQIRRVTGLGVCSSSVQMPIILPHEFFASLYHHYNHFFKDSVLGDDSAIGAFWDSQVHNPLYLSHPVRHQANHRTKAIPLSLHGDEVATFGVSRSWQKGMDVVSWSSLLARPDRSTLEKVFLISLLSSVVASKATRGHWKIIRWSLKWLALGQWPDEDADGVKYVRGVPGYRKRNQPLAGGYFGVLYVIRGDLEWYAKYFDFPRWNSRCPCAFCPATQRAESELYWRHSDPASASFASSLRTTPEWCTNPLLQDWSASFLVLWPDYMHCKHLGTDLYFYSSVMILIMVTFLEGDLADRVEALRDEIKAFDDRSGTRSLTSLNWKRLSIKPDDVGNKFPCLKAKAAETSKVGPALLSIWRARMPARMVPESQRQVEAALAYSVEMDEILTTNKHLPRLPDDVAVRFREATFGFLQLQQQLRVSAPMRLFNITIKSHYLGHIALRGHVLNPVFGWCYSGEDFMQAIKKLALRCVQGNGTHRVPFKIAEKYIRGMNALMDKSSLFRSK